MIRTPEQYNDEFKTEEEIGELNENEGSLRVFDDNIDSK